MRLFSVGCAHQFVFGVDLEFSNTKDGNKSSEVRDLEMRMQSVGGCGEGNQGKEEVQVGEAERGKQEEAWAFLFPSETPYSF
jgi:hypothetical protein